MEYNYEKIIDVCQISLQLLDKQVFTKEDVSTITGVDFETCAFDSRWLKVNNIIKSQILLQLYDKQLVSKESVKEQVINLLK